MSKKFIQNSVYLKDPSSGELMPVGVFGTADEKVIEAVKTGTDNILNDAVARKDELVQSITSAMSTGTDTTLTTAGVPADAKATGDKIGEVEGSVSELKGDLVEQFNNLKNITDEVSTISIMSNFKNGYLDNNGNFKDGKNGFFYYVSSPDIITFKNDTKVTILSGFKMYYSVFENGVYKRDTPWLTGTITIPSGTTCKISINRNPTDTLEVADVVEFTNALTIVLPIIKHINENSNNIKQNVEYASPFWSCITPRKSRFVQHRGYISVAPENSIPAFRLAGESGAYAIECDVRQTSDKKLVIMHDSDISRTTNGIGEVKNLTFEQIRQYRIDVGSNIEQYSSDELIVPTFEEYVKICKQYGMFAVIEVKWLQVDDEQGFTDIYNILRKYGMLHSCLIMVTTDQYINYARSIDLSVNVSLLRGSKFTEDIINTYFSRGYRNFGITTDFNDYSSFEELENIVRFAENKGFVVNVCTTLTETDEENVINTLPDFVTTNLPH